MITKNNCVKISYKVLEHNQKHDYSNEILTAIISVDNMKNDLHINDYIKEAFNSIKHLYSDKDVYYIDGEFIGECMVIL